MIPDRHKKKVTVVAICVACIAPAEGLRRVAYSDPVGIPTICFGETKGVKLGDTATVEQCKAMLETRVAQDFLPAVKKCVPPVSDNRLAAYTSLAYNIGVEAFCKSSVASKARAYDRQGSCDAIRLYVYAKGIKLPGLVKRREQERALCLAS